MAFDSRASNGNPKEEEDDPVDVEVKRLVKLYGLRACRRSLDELSGKERDSDDDEEEARSTKIHVVEQEQGGVKQSEEEEARLDVVDHKLDAEEEEEARDVIHAADEDEEARTSSVQAIQHQKQQKQQQEEGIQEHRHALISTAIMNASADAICVVDALGTIRRVNYAAETSLGGHRGTEQQLVGRNILQIVQLVQRQSLPLCRHDHHLGNEEPQAAPQQIDGIFREQIRQGKNWWREVSARRNDGTEYPALLRIERVMKTSTSKDGCTDDSEDRDEDHNLYVTVIRDCSEMEKAQERLACQCALSEKLKTALLDASPDAIFALCPTDGTILSVNCAGIKMFGYDDTNDGGRREESKQLIGQKIETALGVGCGAGAENGVFLELFGVEHPVPEQPTLPDGASGGAAAAVAPHFQVGRKQRELVCRRRNGSLFPAVVGVQRVEPFLFAFVRDTSEERRARELEVSARSADELLRNLLPDKIIDRLKADPSHLADQHDNAPVLFADIVGFTAMSGKMHPLELVRVLNDLFTRFDGLVEDYGLNKVKTIGDCYMVTSIPRRSDPVKACRAMCYFALDMLEALEEFNTEQQQQQQTNDDSTTGRPQQHHEPLGLRVGINCGTVVAGVVGTNRFLYDLWGDAVNVASRMESTGIPLRIQVTKAVVDQVPKGEFEFNARGPIDVKGKGTMETYFLEKPVRKGNRDLLRQALQENFEPVSPSSLKNTKQHRRLATGPRNLMSLLLGSSRRLRYTSDPSSSPGTTTVNFLSTGTAAVPSPQQQQLEKQPLMRFATTGARHVECSESYKDFMAIMNGGGESCTSGRASEPTNE